MKNQYAIFCKLQKVNENIVENLITILHNGYIMKGKMKNFQPHGLLMISSNTHFKNYTSPTFFNSNIL